MGKSLIEGELIIAVDFDGTITTNPDIDMEKELELQPECARVLRRMEDDGIKLILWTCRTGEALDQAETFLLQNNLYYVFDAINDQTDEVNEKYAPNVARKVGADVYYDDKALLGAKVDWLHFEKFIYGEELA